MTMSKWKCGVLGLNVDQEEMKHPVHLQTPILLGNETPLTLYSISVSPSLSIFSCYSSQYKTLAKYRLRYWNIV